MSSDINVIPAAVSGSGPVFNRFPNEIYIEIFKFLLRLTPEAKLGTIIDLKYFTLLNAIGPFHRLCRVSKHFKMLANVVLYENNVFNFNPKNRGGYEWVLGAFPPVLPPMAVRHHLRRMSITLLLQDYYFTSNPDHPTGGHSIMAQIVTAEQFLQHSVSGRSLRDLTNATSGFSNLLALDITIEENFHFRNNVAATIAAVKAAQISIRAKEVTVKVVGKNILRSGTWYSELAQAILNE